MIFQLFYTLLNGYTVGAKITIYQPFVGKLRICSLTEVMTSVYHFNVDTIFEEVFVNNKCFLIVSMRTLLDNPIL